MYLHVYTYTCTYTHTNNCMYMYIYVKGFLSIFEVLSLLSHTSHPAVLNICLVSALIFRYHHRTPQSFLHFTILIFIKFWWFQLLPCYSPHEYSQFIFCWQEYRTWLLNTHSAFRKEEKPLQYLRKCICIFKLEPRQSRNILTVCLQISEKLVPCLLPEIRHC